MRGGGVGASTDPITNVAHTPVERQSIGNCWIYAHASFIESLVLQHSGQEIDLSQSYWTYWHWFEGIVANDLENGEIGTGVVYYLKAGHVRGVLLWNVWDSVDQARSLIEETAETPVTDPESLRGRIPFG